jgi:geranylgeranyl pyrophosphate synthase
MLRHVLATRGKHIRPALTLLASNFHPNDGRNAETMASAVELLHIASLIHDDTVDDSDTRRGKATVSNLWGRNSAVLLGDYVFATSATFVCDTDNIRVIRRFSETIMELSSGELHEMAVAYDTRQTRDDYLRRIYNKTASLFATAAESGGVLSGAPEPMVQALKWYGYNLGMAFQIVDDILDFDATREEVGKPVGKDLAQGIMTLPSIIAMGHSPDADAISALFERPGDAALLRRAVGLVQAPAIIEESYEEAANYCRLALESVANLERNPSLDSLEELARYVMGRRS